MTIYMMYVLHAATTLNQHWANVSCMLGMFELVMWNMATDISYWLVRFNYILFGIIILSPCYRSSLLRVLSRNVEVDHSVWRVNRFVWLKRVNRILLRPGLTVGRTYRWTLSIYHECILHFVISWLKRCVYHKSGRYTFSIPRWRIRLIPYETQTFSIVAFYKQRYSLLWPHNSLFRGTPAHTAYRRCGIRFSQTHEFIRFTADPCSKFNSSRLRLNYTNIIIATGSPRS